MSQGRLGCGTPLEDSDAEKANIYVSTGKWRQMPEYPIFSAKKNVLWRSSEGAYHPDSIEPGVLGQRD